MRRIAQGVALIVLAASLPGSGQDISQQTEEARYYAILGKNPWNQTAFDRLWALQRTGEDQRHLVRRLEEMSETNPLVCWPLAQACQLSGEVPKAVSALERLESKSLTPLQWVSLGGLWSRLSRRDAAVRAWESASEALDGASASEGLRRELALALVEAGECERAIPQWEALTQSESPEVRLEAFEALADSSRDPEAAARWQKGALDLLTPDHWKFREVLQKTVSRHAQAGRLDALEAEWSRQGTSFQESKRAALARERGDIAGAVACLEKALSVTPQDPELLTEIARLREFLPDAVATEAAWGRLLEVRPEDEEALSGLVSQLLSRGAADQALQRIRAFFGGSLERKIAFAKRIHFPEALGEALRERATAEPKNLEAALELAEFLLQHAGYPEMIAVLDAFAVAEDASTRRKNILRIARFYIERQLFAKAEQVLHPLLEANPTEDWEAALLLADAEDASGDCESAIQVLERTAPPEMPEVPSSLDYRLFGLLQKRDATEDAALRNLSTRAWLRRLVSSAKADTSAALWRRSGRWASWLGEPQASLEYLTRAVALDPSNQTLQEERVEILEKLGETDEALRILEELAASSTSKELDFHIARLEISRGHAEAAIARLQQVIHEHPMDTTAWRELALAQQAAGQNFAAIETWLKAFDLTSSNDRMSLVQPILQLFGKLGLGQRGIAFLEAAASAAPNDAARLEILRMGNAFALESRQTGVWEKYLKRRAGTRGVQAAQWALALADFQPGAGPQPGETRESLTLRFQQAQSRRDAGRALAAAEGLVALPDAGLPDFLQLADALEADGQADRAADLLRELPKRFPRLIEAHLAAARQFAKEHRAVEEISCLRAASRLGPLPPEMLLKIASARNIPREEALGAATTLLRRIPPDASRQSRFFPYPLDLKGTGELVRPQATDPQGARLLALAEVGRILAHSPQREAGIASQTQGGALEAAWAWQGAGETARTMDLVASLDVSEKDARARDLSLALLGLDAGRAQWLAPWAQTDLQWQAILQAVRLLLADGWNPNEDVLDFFQRCAPNRAAAEVILAFAQAGKLRQALQIHIPEDLPAELAFDIQFRRAGWLLALRQPGRAEEALRTAIARGRPGEGLQDPWFAALRALWLLQSPEGRPGIAAWGRQHAEAVGTHPARHATGIVLAALTGDAAILDQETNAWIEALIQGGRLDPAAITHSVATLDSWNLSSAARQVARAVLRSDWDPARKNALEKNLETGLVVSLLLDAPAGDSLYLINEWAARDPRWEDVHAAALRAKGRADYPTARRLVSLAHSRNPAETSIWNTALSLPAEDGTPHFAAEWFLKAPRRIRNTLPAAFLLQLMQDLDATGYTRLADRVLEASPRKDAEVEALRETRQRAFGTQGPSSPPLPKALPAGMDSTADAKSILALLASRPVPERLRLVDLLAAIAPERVREIGPEPLRDLLSSAQHDPALAVAWHGTRYHLARAAGTLDRLEQEFSAAWNHGKGDPLAGEILIRIALEQNATTRLHELIGESLASSQTTPTHLLGLARTLLANNRSQEAARCLQRLDEDGIREHGLALTYAEALWKSGHTEEASALAGALAMAARIDPALRISLAAYSLSIGHPDGALAQITMPDQAAGSREMRARLRAAIADQFLSQNRHAEAAIQIRLAAKVPGAVPTSLALRAVETLGDIPPTENPWGLRDAELFAFQVAAARRLLQEGKPGSALDWLMASPITARRTEAAQIAAQATGAGQEKLASYWRLAAESPWESVRKMAHDHFASLKSPPGKDRVP